MDRLLCEIKNFLKKLEVGQHEIERGQYELYKDITCLKKSFEDFKSLTNDLDELRTHINLIKELEVKVDSFTKQLERKQSNSDKWSEIKKRKELSSWGSNCTFMKNEKSDACSCPPLPQFSIPTCDLSESTDSITEDTASSEVNESSTSTWTPVQNSESRCGLQFKCSRPSASLIHRYLNDANFYMDYRTCGEKKSEKKNCNSCKTTDGNFKKCSVRSGKRRKTLSSISSVCNSCKTSDGNMHSFKKKCSIRGKRRKALSSISSNRSSVQSVISKRFTCPTCPENFGCEDRYKNLQCRPSYTCNVCKKSFKTKDLLKAHKTAHNKRLRTNSFTCGYCKRGCRNLKNLTRHLRNCRNIMRSHFSTQEI